LALGSGVSARRKLGAAKAMAYRFNWRCWGDAFSLPSEVEEMPIFQDWTSRAQAAKATSAFWEVVKPKSF